MPCPQPVSGHRPPEETGWPGHLPARVRPVGRMSRKRRMINCGGWSMSRTIREANPELRGWVNYFHLAGNTTIFQELDSRLRRKLRAILWRQWKRNATRARNLIKLGFSWDAAWRFVRIHRSPRATAGTFNIHRLLKNSYFDSLGLVSLQEQYQRLQRVS